MAAPSIPSTISLTTSGAQTLGNNVSLTASVTLGATGNVTFYDGVTVVGVSPVNSGQATFVAWLIPAGIHNMRAHYSGDGTFLPSDSAPASLRVRAFPTSGRSAVPFPSGFNAPVVADFNSDGRPDVVFNSSTTGPGGGTNLTLNVYTGNGDGTFKPAYSAFNLTPLVVADFNGDGHPDVFAVSSGGGPFSGALLLGNGDGTFAPQIAAPRAAAAADFNGDGKADLIAFGAGNYQIFFGNGDGTFQPGGLHALNAVTLVPGDINNDGKVDLIFDDAAGLHVLPGNGDGTFRAQIDAPFQSLGILAVVDFNQDGLTDVIIEDPSFNGLSVLLGNNDFTFRKVADYPMHAGGSVAVADFDGDGNLDLAINEATVPLTYQIWPGNGDGTLRIPNDQQSGNILPTGIADFNRDAYTDFLITKPDNTLGLVLGAAHTDLTITVSHSGTLTPGTSGSYSITARALYVFVTGQVVVTDVLPSGVTATTSAARDGRAHWPLLPVCGMMFPSLRIWITRPS